MSTYPRIIERAGKHLFLLFHGYSIREIAKITGWSKSTVHYDLTVIAPTYYPAQTPYIKRVLKYNFTNRGKFSARKYKEKNS